MREIKFRGYDTELEKMTYFDDNNYILQYGDILRQYIDDCDDFGNLEFACESVKDKVELMQYTGLKDKNVKKIYEGDILLAPEWFGRLKCVCIYQQENNVNPIQGFGLYSYDSYFRKYNTLVESDEWDEFEVIGNIYDNPELLEEGE